MEDRRACPGIRVTGCLLFAVAIAGCSPAPPAPPPAAAVAAPAADTPPPAPRLPVSLNELMVALVNPAADPLWVAAWKNPQSDADWRRLEHLAYQLDIAGALLRMPGTGPLDDKWTADPAWGAFAQRLGEVGERAIAAVQARDIAEIAAAGDELVETCEACHLAFKPDVPTGGKFGDLPVDPSTAPAGQPAAP
jgi:hypothetical protein